MDVGVACDVSLGISPHSARTTSANKIVNLFLSPEGCRRVLTPRCSMLSHLQKEQSPSGFEPLSPFLNDDQSLVGLTSIPHVECRINLAYAKGTQLKRME